MNFGILFFRVGENFIVVTLVGGDWVYTSICIVAKWQENKSVVKILFHHKINTDKWTLLEYGGGGQFVFERNKILKVLSLSQFVWEKIDTSFIKCLFSDTQIWAILSDMIMSDFFFRCRRNLRSILDQMCKKFSKKVSEILRAQACVTQRKKLSGTKVVP